MPLNYFFLLSLFCVDFFFSHLSILLASVSWGDFSDGCLWWWMWPWFLRWIYFFSFYLFLKSASSCFISSCSLLWTFWFIRCLVFLTMYLIFIWAVAIFFWCGFITWYLFFPHFSSFSWKVTLHRYLAGSFLLITFVSEVNPSSYLREVPSQDRPELCSKPELTFFGSRLSSFMAQWYVCTFILP